MKTVIWKFPIPAEGAFTLDLPEGPCHPLAVQMQTLRKGEHVSGKEPQFVRDPHTPQEHSDVAVLWIRVSAEPYMLKTKHTFHVVPTGQPFDDEGLRYVGTFQPLPGLVFHLFQESRSP